MARPSAFSTTQSVIHLLHRAGQVSEERFTKIAGYRGLTSRQLVVLEIVAAADKPSQTTVCDGTGIDRSTLADIVRRLVSRGLIARRRSREDARRYVLRLTDEGRRALNQGLPILRAVESTILNDLSQTERESLFTSLRRIANT